LSGTKHQNEKARVMRAFFYWSKLINLLVMKSVDQIVKRDEKILSKEKSYRRARLWCIFLAVFTALVTVGISIGTVFVLKKPLDMEFIAISEINLITWLALAWISHQRLQHIQTIKLGRYCPACNYDLHGNPDATHYPECGAAVKPGVQSQ